MAFFTLFEGFSQSAVTGTVKDINGDAVPFASVSIKGSHVAVSADEGGKFTIIAPADAILVISATGFSTQEIKASGGTVNVTLETSMETIEEVVVTALGFKRLKKEATSASQEVKGSDLTQTTQTNILNSMSGRVAGVQITAASGAVGASSRIVLRGNNSFGNNQPLIVVDGVPISNSATNVGAYGSVDYGSGIQEIDPNTIESVTVLKGNNAALYGYRAANGVILITTKSGKGSKGLGVAYSGGLSFDNPYILPYYQNKYGQGALGDEFTWKRDQPGMSYQDYAGQYGFSYVDGGGGGVNDGTDESWGPRLDAGLHLPQYNSPLDANGNKIATPWISHPNNVRDFFQTGHTLTNSVTLTSNNDERGNTRVSLGHQNQIGSVPNTDQTRYTLSLNTIQNLTSKLTFQSNINYVRTENKNLVGQGYNGFNPMQSIGSWFGRQVDMNDLRANYTNKFENGLPYNWNSSYHDNPYSSLHSVFNNKRQKDRVYGYVSASYDFHKWFKLTGRAGNDWSTEFRKELSTSRHIGNLLAGLNGTFLQRQYNLNELNLDLMMTGGDQIGSNFSVDYLLGANYRNYTQKNTSIGADNLTVPDLFTIANAKGSTIQTMYDYHLRSTGIFGQLNLSFRKWLIFNLTARNDWNSSLPAANRSYFYPSIGGAWIFSDALNISSDIFSYGKLRASWARVGNATDPYQVFPTFTPLTYTYNGVTLYRYPATIPAGINLKPEMAKNFEAGFELAFLNNRIAIDATYYDKATTDQIMAIDVSSAGGSSTMVINAGEIQNKGVEIQLNLGIIRPITPEGFSWDMSINFAKNTNTVNKLYTDPNTGDKLESFKITGAWGVTVDAIPGQAYGVIRGDRMVRNDKGQVVVGANGRPAFEANQAIGNITPDFVGGVNNNLKFKNFNLNFLIDFRKGGDIFSVTDMFGAYAGVVKYTADNNVRENGVIYGRDIMPEVEFIKADGSVNDIPVAAATAYKWVSYASSGGSEFDIVDGSFIKLRQIQLGYNLPARTLRRVNWIRSANISLFSYNVALLAKHKSNRSNIDPETGFGVGNDGLGVEQNQIPSNRSIGIQLNLNF